MREGVNWIGQTDCRV